ncbi:DUF1178 family protein [Erythrobacter sp. SCSIO 43205]|uniref:DUF1178 family protein n=1 Tax=Erythrobacter sp. SCSIO 43205 TaxID=2779361 RepID=UPI001CA81070|nr:DUF1178 family protein [Erythrobacter sp. SCSIO 43205]UAB77208.1 DUF1178 family protein [Erythrobacter sp. SCSIO 43205]
MIVFDLHCEHGHRFEGWFKSSSNFEEQQARGLVTCPQCESDVVSKAPMAPAVPAKGNTRQEVVPATQRQPAPAEAQAVSNAPPPEEVKKAIEALAKAQAKALEKSTYVGKNFVKEAREMHYGERDEAPIHGQASLEEAKQLAEEGVPVAPLPFPVAPPEKLN